MKKSILRSIAAILAGFIAGAAPSIGTDILLDRAGFLNRQTFIESPWWIFLIVVIYRFVFNVIGCYIAASLAPNRPMRHAMILGFIGLVFSTLGAIAMWDQAVPAYNISVILIALPSAWLGGRLRERVVYSG